MLRVVYLIDHKYKALTYTPMLRVVYLTITNTSETLTYTPMLRVVYLIYHNHKALTYTPMLRVVYLIITNTSHSRTPHVKGCVCDLSQTPGTHVHHHFKGCVCAFIINTRHSRTPPC